MQKSPLLKPLEARTCTKLRLLAVVVGLSCLTAVAAAQKITNPLPEPIPESTLGVVLKEWVQVPDSPINRRAPRLNMMRQTADGRYWVNDQRGYLYVIDSEGGQASQYLEVRQRYPMFAWITSEASQTGFSSFAFHPEFASNGIFYTVVSVNRTSGSPTYAGKRPIPGTSGTLNPSHHDVLLRWQAEDPAANVFSGTVSELMRIEQPYADHNVGEIAFNPLASEGDADYGLLYMAVADGGWIYLQISPDPQRNGQDLSTPLGKILRIDPEGDNGPGGKFGIPATNPFVETDGALGEIYAYGLRNPHRISWDALTGRMFTFDIGGGFIEEVSEVVAGGNYGWSLREGTWLHDEGDLYPLPAEDAVDLVYPIAQYAHAFGNGAISVGFVYRGTEIQGLNGHLIFMDFTNSGLSLHAPVDALASLEPRETLPLLRLQIFNGDGEKSSLSRVVRGEDGQRTDARIAADLNNELYLLNKHNGWIYRMLNAPVNPQLPLRKSASWYFDPDNGWVYIDFSALPWAWFNDWQRWLPLQ